MTADRVWYANRYFLKDSIKCSWITPGYLWGLDSQRCPVGILIVTVSCTCWEIFINTNECGDSLSVQHMRQSHAVHSQNVANEFVWNVAGSETIVSSAPCNFIWCALGATAAELMELNWNFHSGFQQKKMTENKKAFGQQDLSRGTKSH